jgi:hypothetical protein
MEFKIFFLLFLLFFLLFSILFILALILVTIKDMIVTLFFEYKKNPYLFFRVFLLEKENKNLLSFYFDSFILAASRNSLGFALSCIPLAKSKQLSMDRKRKLLLISIRNGQKSGLL